MSEKDWALAKFKKNLFPIGFSPCLFGIFGESKKELIFFYFRLKPGKAAWFFKELNYSITNANVPASPPAELSIFIRYWPFWRIDFGSRSRSSGPLGF